MSATGCVGAKVNGKMCHCPTSCVSGDIVEVLTSKRERGPSRDWLSLVKTTRARNQDQGWYKAETRKDTEHADVSCCRNTSASRACRRRRSSHRR